MENTVIMKKKVRKFKHNDRENVVIRTVFINTLRTGDADLRF